MASPRRAHTAELAAKELAEIRELLDGAFEGDFSDEDWEHSLGGVHVLLHEEDVLVGHASVVQRRLVHDDRAIRTGYVEAVAVAPGRRGWLRWEGPTWALSPHGPIRTEDDDGGVFVLPTPSSPRLDLAAPIACDWRPGDVW